VRYTASPNGAAWIARDLLETNGDVFSLPAISQLTFNLPQLTPTQPVLQSSAILGGTPVPLSPAFKQLGSQLWDIVLSSGFDPATSRFGALFVMDLQTGEAWPSTPILPSAARAFKNRYLETPWRPQWSRIPLPL
jgi:hypothetical protein